MSLTELEWAKYVISKWVREERNLVPLDINEFISQNPELLSDVRSNTLVFLEGKNKVAIYVVTRGVSRDEISREIATKCVAKLRDFVDKIYVAIPITYRFLVDGRLIKELGIGLLVYDLDKGNVEELVPAKPITRPKVAAVDLRRLEELEERIANIEYRLENLMKEVSELRRTISAIERSLLHPDDVRRMVTDVLERELSRIRRELSSYVPTAPSAAGVEVAAEISQEVPSGATFWEEYLKDHPWVEVLRKRSKEGGESG